MARGRGPGLVAAALATVVAASLAGCTPSQEHMALVNTPTVPQGSPITATVGGDLGPELGSLDHLEMLVAPLVDRGTRQWDQMPSNLDQGRVLPGTASTHAYVSEPSHLAPGNYALWFRWGADGEDHTDGYGVVTVAP